MQELWRPIPGFEIYEVSQDGLVRRSFPDEHLLTPYALPDGSLGVKLHQRGHQHQKLIRRLVAEAFCVKPSESCDTVIQKDYNKANCNASNLAWRPRWFAWRYYHQQYDPILPEWTYKPVRNIMTNMVHPNVVEAGMYDGITWAEVYKSADKQFTVFPFTRYEFVTETF